MTPGKALTIIATFVVTITLAAPSATARGDLSRVREASFDVQPKVVKIYGAGGLSGLEAYQTGFLVSPEGHIATASSIVLDNGQVTVVRSSGERFGGKVVGVDPIMALAVIKIDLAGEEAPYFDLDAAATAAPGDWVLAFSNMFGIAAGAEPVSVLHGVVAAIAPLEAGRGVFTAAYRGDVYIVDAVTSNPGAAGAPLTDINGRLLGMVGKELESTVTGTWLNYAIPAASISPSIAKIIAGKHDSLAYPDDEVESGLTPEDYGFLLVAEIVDRTPPYIEHVRPGSPAHEAGLRPDDLVVFVDDLTTASRAEVVRLLSRRTREAPLRVTVQRGNGLVEFTLPSPEVAAPQQ